MAYGSKHEQIGKAVEQLHAFVSSRELACL